MATAVRSCPIRNQGERGRKRRRRRAGGVDGDGREREEVGAMFGLKGWTEEVEA